MFWKPLKTHIWCYCDPSDHHTTMASLPILASVSYQSLNCQQLYKYFCFIAINYAGSCYILYITGFKKVLWWCRKDLVSKIVKLCLLRLLSRTRLLNQSSLLSINLGITCRMLRINKQCTCMLALLVMFCFYNLCFLYYACVIAYDLNSFMNVIYLDHLVDYHTSFELISFFWCKDMKTSSVLKRKAFQIKNQNCSKDQKKTQALMKKKKKKMMMKREKKMRYNGHVYSWMYLTY